MSNIIHLQNLPVNAKSGDIRYFFRGLRIPDGGVHILGGEDGEAFIVFSSCEEAQRGMKSDGDRIKQARIKLSLSNEDEMRYKIERLIKRKLDENPYEKGSVKAKSRYSEKDEWTASESIKSSKKDSHFSPRSRSPHRERSPHSRRSRLPKYEKSYSSEYKRSVSPNEKYVARLRSRSPGVKYVSPTRRLLSPHGPRSQHRSPIRSHSRKSRSPLRRSRSPLRSADRKSVSPRSDSPYNSQSSRRNLHLDRKSHTTRGRLSKSPLSERSASKFSNLSFPRKLKSTEILSFSKDISDLKPNLIENATREKLLNFNILENPNWHTAQVLQEHSANFQTQDYYKHQEVKIMSKEEHQAALEKRITEALNNGYVSSLMQKASEMNSNRVNISDVEMFINKCNNITPSNFNSYTENQPVANVSVDSSAYGGCVLGDNYSRTYTVEQVFPTVPGNTNPYGEVPPDLFPAHTVNNFLPEMNAPMPMFFPNESREFFPINEVPQPRCIVMSGLAPKWDFRDVHAILKGVFAPQNNIKWEQDERGMRTGTVFVKLINPEDYRKVLEQGTCIYKSQQIVVKECPDFISKIYFGNLHTFDGLDINQNKDLCYLIKGLPFSTTYDDVASFFDGLQLSDIYIIYNAKGKATGTGYVVFTNFQDYVEALHRNGKKIGHRYIQLQPSKISEMIDIKRRNGDYCSAKSTNSARPLCALLTGLPLNINSSAISSFFAKSGVKPDAIHITLNDKHKPNGRAFVEFRNFLDFDAALKCHRNYIGDKMICVKQILFDEMETILMKQRAKHDFNELPKATETDLPEKVPWLWEPPDEATDGSVMQENYYDSPEKVHNLPVEVNDLSSQKYQSHHSNSVSSNWLNSNSKDHDLDSQKEQSNQSNAISSNWFNSNSKYSGTGGNLKVLGSKNKQRSFKKKEAGKTLKPTTFRAVVDLNSEDNVFKESNKTPLKFEMKSSKLNVQVTKADNSFSDALRDDKKKLPKLSPTRETLASGQNSHDGKEFNVNVNLSNKKVISPQSKDKSMKTMSEKKPEVFNVSHKLNKFDNPKPKQTDKMPTNKIVSLNKRKKMNKFKNRMHFNLEQKFHHDNFARSLDERDRMNWIPSQPFDGSVWNQPCEIQLSNVHPSVGTKALEHFFADFSFDRGNCIRGFTEFGEPTGDVRVTFPNRQEAERAVHMLSGSYLEGIPVEMFLLN